MQIRKTVAALAGTLALAAIAYAQTNDRLKVTEKGAEAKFVLVDPTTGVQTVVVVFSSSRTILDPPQQRGPLNQPFTSLQVTQQTADGTFVFTGTYTGTGLVPSFTGKSNDITGATLAGEFLMDVETQTSTLVPASINLSWTATGPDTQEIDTNTLVIPGGSVTSSQIRGLHRTASATGTLTIDGVTYQLSTVDAELQKNNTGELTVSLGSN